MVKNLPAVRETQVRSLGQEDALEKGVATHSSVLAWRSPWTEEPGGLQSLESQRVGCARVTDTFTFIRSLVYRRRGKADALSSVPLTVQFSRSVVSDCDPVD